MRSLGRTRPLLVYQMGKVGSTAVAAALGEVLDNRPVMHFHRLADDVLTQNDAQLARRFCDDHSIGIDPGHLRARYITDRLEFWARQGGVDVITMSREPVERDLSAMFQWLPVRYPAVAERLRRQLEWPQLDAALRALFVDGSINNDSFDWFDRKLRAVTDIDIFSTPFDAVAGFHIYERVGFRVAPPIRGLVQTF
jgi:hypothetical protein